jgi:hypothetical protein
MAPHRYRIAANLTTMETNFQSKGALSNGHAEREFEEAAQLYFKVSFQFSSDNRQEHHYFGCR